jgi:hypothetical protein
VFGEVETLFTYMGCDCLVKNLTARIGLSPRKEKSTAPVYIDGVHTYKGKL